MLRVAGGDGRKQLREGLYVQERTTLAVEYRFKGEEEVNGDDEYYLSYI